MKLNKLYSIIEKRKKGLPKNSYTANIFRAGKDKIIQKVGEEAVEVIIAAKNSDKKALISELADLQYHLLVLLSQCSITPEDIEEELEKRMKKL